MVGGHAVEFGSTALDLLGADAIEMIAIGSIKTASRWWSEYSYD